MKRSLAVWQFAGFTFTAVLGTLLHFLYEWTQIIAFAPFSAVNESTWEHMKILFFPMFIFALIQSKFFSKDYDNFWCVKLIGILTGTALIAVLFYTYNGVFDSSPAWVNIIIFYLAGGIAFWLETKLLKAGNLPCKSKILPIVILSGISLAFMLFTFIPPKIPLFQDPVSRLYGIQK